MWLFFINFNIFININRIKKFLIIPPRCLRFMQLHMIDVLVIFIYLFFVTGMGLWSGRNQKSMHDYFLARRNLPWYAVCLSIVATETSSLTFISIPGLAYISNLNFLQIAFGYIAGRIIISYLFLPAYFKGELYTSYQLLSIRFGGLARTYASIVFLITRWLSDGVRLFATAIPVALLTGWSYTTCIIIIMSFTFVYTYFGGIRAVVWMDVFQTFIYLAGAALAGILILHQIDGGWRAAYTIASQNHKWQIFYSGFDLSLRDFFKTNYTFFSGILGGAFLSMASHGTDQLMVQRLLTCRNVRESQKALIASGFFVLFQFLLFLGLGVLLFVYYKGMPLKPDEVLPRFVVNGLPAGISGLIIAGILAAAMSTLSGSLNSLASSSMMDLYKIKKGANNSAGQDLKLSRLFTLGWTLAFIAIAMLFQNRENPVVELGLAIASFTYGGMLGLFFLGVLNPKVREQDAVFSMWAAIYIMTWLIGQKGGVLIIMCVLNLIFGLWLLLRTRGRMLKVLIVVTGVLVSVLIIAVPTIPLGWPWYVVIGSITAYGIGSVLTWLKKE
jgi:solute:Na+ symporter, SSS family